MWPAVQLAAVVAATEREIGLFSRFSASYGYVFYLLRKALQAASSLRQREDL